MKGEENCHKCRLLFSFKAMATKINLYYFGLVEYEKSQSFIFLMMKSYHVNLLIFLRKTKRTITIV